jgi:hypothetical protein
VDRVLVLPDGAITPLVLSGSAAVVWDLVEQPATLSDLVQALAEIYEEDADRIEADLRASLDEMKDLGVINDVDAA